MFSSSKQGKKNSVNCIGCCESLALDHNGIKCPQNHHLCGDCSKSYINLIFAEPEQNLPPSCLDCRAELLMNTVEMQFNNEEAAIFQRLMLSYVYVKTMVDDEHEVVVHCPFCNYSEIRDKKDGLMFVFCQNDKCSKMSCYFCHLECKPDDSDEDSDEESDNWEDTGLLSHYECAADHPLKSKIENAIEDGLQTQCPNCNIKGRKDDACTHMRCVKCNTMYCYVCGLSEDNCDKEQNDEPTIYHHNIDWHINPRRCPMYLSEISDIDNRWPDETRDEDECLDFFHKIKIRQNLKKLFGQEKFHEIQEIENKYGILSKAGYDIDKIQDEDSTLIHRNEIDDEEE